MKFSYFPETDTLYIRFADRSGTDVVEITEGMIADVDAQGVIVGIEIDSARTVADLQGLVFERIPAATIQFLREPPETPAIITQ